MSIEIREPISWIYSRCMLLVGWNVVKRTIKLYFIIPNYYPGHKMYLPINRAISTTQLDGVLLGKGSGHKFNWVIHKTELRVFKKNSSISPEQEQLPIWQKCCPGNCTVCGPNYLDPRRVHSKWKGRRRMSCFNRKVSFKHHAGTREWVDWQRLNAIFQKPFSCRNKLLCAAVCCYLHPPTYQHWAKIVCK